MYRPEHPPPLSTKEMRKRKEPLIIDMTAVYDVHQILGPCPEIGEGVHFARHGEICTLARLGYDPDEIREMINEWGPPAPHKIEESLAKVFVDGDPRLDGYRYVSKPKIAKQPEQMHEIWRDCCPDGVDILRQQSSLILKAWKLPTCNLNREILGRLYGGDDLICYGGPNLNKTSTDYCSGYWATTIEKWILGNGDLSVCPLIVPNPMTALFGKTKWGKQSPRCLENAAYSRKYLVMDFDLTLEGPFAEVIIRVVEQMCWSPRKAIHSLTAAVILWLRERTDIPLIMVVDSGGKSLHAWWYVEGLEDSKQRQLFYEAAAFGADQVILQNNSQFVRMPGGTREITKARQEVVYWSDHRG